jgi:hypothetical protein
MRTIQLTLAKYSYALRLDLYVKFNIESTGIKNLHIKKNNSKYLWYHNNGYILLSIQHFLENKAKELYLGVLLTESPSSNFDMRKAILPG